MAGANKSAGGGRGEMMPPPGQPTGLQNGITWHLLGPSRCEAGLELACLERHVLVLCFSRAPALP